MKIGHDVQTARFAGWHELTDNALLDAMEGRFDVLVTLSSSTIGHGH